MKDPADVITGLRRGEMASSHFTIIANAVARDKTLSNRARGLFLNMASHQEGFTITEEFLASQCTDGIKVIRATLLELRKAGYVYRSQERSRYAKGTRNAKGKDISGALGPYQWFVTDKPDEIAAILSRYAQEQRALNEASTAILDAADGNAPGQDNLPFGEVVPTCGNTDDPIEHESTGLPPQTAASDDLGKHPITAGRDYLPKPTGGFGSSIEEQKKKTIDKEKHSGGLPPEPPDPVAHATGRTKRRPTRSVTTSQLKSVGDHQYAHACERAGRFAVEAIQANPDMRPAELAPLVVQADLNLTPTQAHARAAVLAAWHQKLHPKPVRVSA